MNSDSSAKEETAPSRLPHSDPGITTAGLEPARKRRMVSLRTLLFVLPVATMLGGVIGLYFQPPGLRALFAATGLEPGGGTSTPIAVAIQRVAAGEQVSLVSEGDVVALGRLIPRGDVATVSTPFGAGDARIDRIDVSVGDLVQRGDTIAVLDNLQQLKAALKIAEANVIAREAALGQARVSTRASLDEARATLSRAEATSDAALVELERATTMLERGITTRANFDRAQKIAAESIRDVERARATVTRFTADGETQQADLAVAEANVVAARAEAARALADIDRAHVRAPIDGQILQIHVRPGEKPDLMGVADVGDTSDMIAELEVFQTMIRRIALGDSVVLSSQALDDDLIGTVSAIGLQIGRQSILADDPAANLDARVVDVIVDLDDASSQLASALTNLEVVARIDTGEEG